MEGGSAHRELNCICVPGAPRIGGSYYVQLTESAMWKVTLAILASVASFLTLASIARANEMISCDSTDLQMVQAKLDAANDPALKDRKDIATKELELAKAAMKARETDDCSMHLANAMSALMRAK